MTNKAVNWGKAVRRHLANAFLLCVCGFLLHFPVYGLERDRTIAQFYHSAWTAKDGAPSQISALTQTADGYLWIGSARGLFRFDGIQFELYAPPSGVNLPSQNIYALMATPDGGLWVSFRPSGIGFLKDGVMRIFTRPEEIPPSWVYCFARDLDNRIWAGTHAGLALLEDSHWIDIGADWSFEPGRIRTMFVDRNGTLWVATDRTILFLPRGSKQFQPTGGSVGTVSRMAQGPDVHVWMAELENSARPIPTGRQNSQLEEPEILADANDVLFDREGSLWITTSDGIKRVRFPENLDKGKITDGDPRVETFKESDGLTDNSIHNLFEDREGNVWVSSVKGLDCFRYSKLVPVKLPPGHQYSTLLAGEQGEVWAASASEKSLVRIRGEDVISQKAPTEISSVYQDPSGVIWWGGYGGMWRQNKNRFDFFSQPNLTTPDFVWEIIRTNENGGLWIGLGDFGLINFKNERWTTRAKPSGLLDRVPSASFHDSSGRIWLGYTENRVYTIDGESVQFYTSAHGINIGRIKVIRGHGSHFWFGGELGLATFNNGRFTTIRTANGASFGAVSGIVEARDGALWLNELHGVIRISPEQVSQVVENPEHAVAYQSFDFLDGLPGGTQMNYTVSTAIEGSDGRLWFATDNGLAWIDPERISKNVKPPPVSIRSLNTEIKTYEPSAGVSLPQGTQSLRIDYTALSLSIPERVHFRYKLDGADDDWQDAGTRRQAFYTNLAPGNYRFCVVAANNDGVWNETGAILQFSIAPAFYQTNWFYLLCLVIAAGFVWMGYRWRIHYVKSRLHLQFEDRLAERTRIAQELHDTLLQGVFSASVQLDAAAEQLSDNSPIKPKLGRVSQLMSLVLTEGRNTVRGLHSPNRDDSFVLEKAFSKIKQDLDAREQSDFRVIVKGETRLIHPIVRDEIYRLGREALVNAFRHSKAGKIEVEIEYAAKIFKIFIRDDGCGINPDILRSGREGHLGLSGMRQCAERIGAKLKILSQAESGTEVELSVPARIAFKTEFSGNYFKRLNNILSRRKL